MEPVRAAPSPAAAVESVRTAAIAAPAAEPGARLPRADLATVLARSSPAVTTATSLNALLDIWGEAPTPSELMSLPQALETLENRGLAVMPLRGASLATLQLFNYPAILELSALDGMPRFVLLTGLEGEDALITGIGDGLPLRVPFVQVEHHWGGDAWVAWRDFEDLPEILRPPLRGAPVIWLQQALGRMGFYDGALTGEFDAATIAGVRDLQASLQIQVDGTVGRVTKLRLYERLGLYAVPRLARARRGDRLSTILRALQRVEGEKGGDGETGGLRDGLVPRGEPLVRPGRARWRIGITAFFALLLLGFFLWWLIPTEEVGPPSEKSPPAIAAAPKPPSRASCSASAPTPTEARGRDRGGEAGRAG